MDSDTTQTDDPGRDPDAASTETAPEHQLPAGGKDEFLMPGPTSSSNQGTVRWAISWIGFSLALMLFMLLITLACFGIARLGGLA